LSLFPLIGAEIYGNAKEYANSEIKFYKYADRITLKKEQLFTLEIDEKGEFGVNVEVDEITYVFGLFGIYHAYFFLEPDGKYELLLPEYVEKSPEDIFNPYFEPEYLHVGIKNLNKTDLNYLIVDFDYYYNRYIDLNFFEIYFEGPEYDVDTFIKNIKAHFEGIDNEYFGSYMNFRIAALKNIATQKKYEPAVVLAYFTRSPVLYDNPAYMDLFNNIYSSYFDKYLISKKGPFLYAVINYGHSITRLRRLLAQERELRNEQFMEMVMLKGLHDAFGNRNLSWLPLLLTLDSLSMSTKYDYHKEIAQNIADDVLTMAENTGAPVFELPDIDENTKSLTDYRGKYIYLQFANTDTYTSQMEFELVKKIYDRYKGACIFLTILTDKDTIKAKKFIEKNKLEWDFLFAPINSPVISMYKVDAYPAYFLIDPYGFLKMSPAPSPAENFESALFRILEAERSGKVH
jgi:peroxiredoxin